MGVRAVVAGTVLVVGAACGGPDAGRSTTGAGTAPPSVRYQLHVSAGGIVPPGEGLLNPFEDSTAAAEGQRLFGAMNCDGCHGVGATGFAAPSLVDGRWRYGGDDGALYHSIFYGRPRGMPAYGGMLSPATIWQLVAYLRSQPVPREVPTENWERAK